MMDDGVGGDITVNGPRLPREDLNREARLPGLCGPRQRDHLRLLNHENLGGAQEDYVRTLSALRARLLRFFSVCFVRVVPVGVGP